MRKKKKKGCKGCGSYCGVRGCLVCRGKMLCFNCIRRF